MFVIRLMVCCGYWLLLTLLLLVPNPASLLGLRHAPHLPWGDFGVHFVALGLLTVLLHATGWPHRLNWWLVGILLFYAVVAETAQYFVPMRCVELSDYLQNIAGVVVGSAAYAVVQALAKSRERPNLLEALKQA